MDDYLSLIKNPKAKSPRVPTSPLVANQRQSPSTSNAGSTSPLNLSSLNRPIATSPYAQPTNIFNPQPLSRRSSQAASPLDQSADSILRRSTPSFIGNTTSQIIPRPQGIDQSLSGSAARSRDLDYDGLNRVSQVSRRSQLSSADRSPSFGGQNDSLRNSIIKTSRKLEKKVRKLDWAMVSLGIIAVAIVFLSLRVIFPSNIVYCDTGKFDDLEWCTPCPSEGRCEGGKLVECFGTSTLHKNQCVPNYEAKTRFAKYRKYISDRLAVKKGEKLCNNNVNDDMSLLEIIDNLKAHFSHDTYLQDSRLDLTDFENKWIGFLEKGSDALIYQTSQNTYKTKAVADPPLSCKMTLLWTEGKLFGIWIAFFIASVVVLVKFGITRVVYTNLATELYAEVLDYLSYWNKTTVKTLKREFEHRYPGKDFEKLWHYVTELVIKGGRINRYFDYYRDEKQVQEFWALLY